MKIEYVNKVDYCCKEMKELMKNDDLITYGNNNLIFRVRFGNKDWLGIRDSIEFSILYCPFCGKKIEILKGE